MSLIDMVQQHLGPSEIAQIGQHLGVDPATAQKAVSSALPMLMGGMARHAASGGGANVQQAASTHGNALDNLGSLLQAGAPADAGGLLARVLGQHQTTVQQGVQQSTGLDANQSHQLMGMLAPAVLSALSKHPEADATAQRQGNSLAGVLQREAKSAQAQSPQSGGGMLGKLLGDLPGSH
jgi:hypothetical protein